MSKLWATSRLFNKGELTRLTWRRGHSKLFEVLDDTGIAWSMDIQDGRPTFSHRRIRQVRLKPTQKGYIRTEVYDEL